MDILRQCTLYVQAVVQTIDDPAESLVALLSSGYEAVSTNNTQHPLDAPHLDGIDNTGTGSLTLRRKTIRNARLYQVQRKTGTGGWQSAGGFQSTRGISVTGLTPGTMYTFQVRAVGGSTGQSDWSYPSSHMSM